MRALVVFESMYGNTKAIADAVAQGLASSIEVEVVEVPAAPPSLSPDVALVVVGAPTHAFGLSRPGTRANAAKQGQARPGTAERGVREWLATLHGDAGRVAAATFDTRILKPRVPGSAARGAQRRMRRLGFRIAAPAKSFYVVATPGPLADGELERARDWGAQIASVVTPVT